VVAGVAGVGLVEAAIGATAAIAQVRPEAVIFVGTAGLYPNRRPDLAMAGAVAARRLVLSADGVDDRRRLSSPALPATHENHTGAPQNRRCDRAAHGRRGVSTRHHVPADRGRTSCPRPDLRPREPRSLRGRPCRCGCRPALCGHSGHQQHRGPVRARGVEAQRDPRRIRRLPRRPRSHRESRLLGREFDQTARRQQAGLGCAIE